MKRTGILTLLFVQLLLPAFLSAQEIREEESLNYCYLGPVLSASYNRVVYRDWLGTTTGTRSMTGFGISGGAALAIFADNFCGDFHLKYSYNSLDYMVTYFDFLIAGKYLYPVNSNFLLGGGLGIYFNTPPSNRKYNGSGGLHLPLSVYINTSPSTKMFFDIYARYGSFGVGENTESISAGINAGFIIKVGRI